ncbi:MAG: TIR domain-containing protein, partial [Pseudomonadales bacterium]
IFVNFASIDENLDPQTIRRIIRDNYLRDSDVTVLLCGTETRFRKHVDWELKSSMINGSRNRQSGILVIDLPTSSSKSWHAVYSKEKEIVYPDYQGGWRHVSTLTEYEELYPEMPRRILGAVDVQDFYLV